MTKAKVVDWTCKDCNISVALSIDILSQHLKSADHKKKQKGKIWKCDDCDRTMIAIGPDIVAHINFAKHEKKYLRLEKENRQSTSEKKSSLYNDNFPQASPSRTEKQEWTVGNPPVRIEYIQTSYDLQKAVLDDQLFRSIDSEDKVKYVIAITCIGAPECLSLLQIATPTVIYVFDCVTLRPDVVIFHLNDIFE